VFHRFEVSFANRGFQAQVAVETPLESFEVLRDDLISLNRSLNGKVSFDTIEGDFTLQAEVDKFGHVTWSGTIGLYAGGHDDARLDFWIIDDQTCLSPIITQIDALIAEARREHHPG